MAVIWRCSASLAGMDWAGEAGGPSGVAVSDSWPKLGDDYQHPLAMPQSCDTNRAQVVVGQLFEEFPFDGIFFERIGILNKIDGTKPLPNISHGLDDWRHVAGANSARKLRNNP